MQLFKANTKEHMELCTRLWPTEKSQQSCVFVDHLRLWSIWSHLTTVWWEKPPRTERRTATGTSSLVSLASFVLSLLWIGVLLSVFVQTPSINFMFTCLSILLVTSSRKVIELEFMGISFSLLLWCTLQGSWRLLSEDRLDIWSQLLCSSSTASHLFESFVVPRNQPGLECFSFG